jgi:hypothetical protein
MARMKTKLSAEEIEAIRYNVSKAIAPLCRVKGPVGYPFGLSRTKAGRELPPYYLVYFLLVDLLQFPHGGKWEKVAWTVPVEYDGSAAYIEHRKLGLGVFSAASATNEKVATEIVKAIGRGIKMALPYFDYLAAKAVENSQLNVTNNSGWLLARYEYLRDRFREKTQVPQSLQDKVEMTETRLSDGTIVESFTRPAAQSRKEAAWLGIAAIEAFFGWTEHVLVHIAILTGNIKTGEEVANLALADWSEKIKKAIGLADNDWKILFDELLGIRRQIRNYMAHGAFGKQGEAFQFHSAAGAVPVNLTDPDGRDRYSFWFGPSFDEEVAIETAETFIQKLWEGTRAPAKFYIQEAGFPSILTFASDGSYDEAMKSVEHMEEFVTGLGHQMDIAANMDW